METERMIRELENVKEEFRGQIVSGTSLGAMVEDVIRKIKDLEREKETVLKDCLEKYLYKYQRKLLNNNTVTYRIGERGGKYMAYMESIKNTVAVEVLSEMLENEIGDKK